jgi:hypothetical protein
MAIIRYLLSGCAWGMVGFVFVLVGVPVLFCCMQMAPPAELSKEEVRHLLRGVKLPESLNPAAVRAVFSADSGSYILFMRIHVEGAQADVLLGDWLKEASRVTSNPRPNHLDWKSIWSGYNRYAGSALHPFRDDDILVFKDLGEGQDAEFLLRKRDAGVDIYCSLYYVSQSHISVELQSVMRQGQGIRLGPGATGQRRLGEFESD